MPVLKEKILLEIKNLAETNKGKAPSMSSFEQATGIQTSDWRGRYWTKWSDVLEEAGYSPNSFGSPKIEEDRIFEQLAVLTKELGHFPNRYEITMRKRSDSKLVSTTTLRNKFGSKHATVSKLLEFVRANSRWRELIEICEKELLSFNSEELSIESEDVTEVGYVYLIRHGQRNEYKIGFTKHLIRREGEISIQLPEKVAPVFYIETDDPSGVEAYWHSRFSNKRKNGEWFQLSASDVKAFKKWKKIY